MQRMRERFVVAVGIAALAMVVTALPAMATAPTSSELKSALLTRAQMSGWSKFSLPEPEGKSLCNVDRRVMWETYAGAYFENNWPKFFGESLFGYKRGTQAHKAYRDSKAASFACKSFRVDKNSRMSIRHVPAPRIGSEAYAIRTTVKRVGLSPSYCFRVVVRHRQVVHVDLLCSYVVRPSRDRAMRLIRKAYRVAVGHL